jgi:hypothetical protein
MHRHVAATTPFIRVTENRNPASDTINTDKTRGTKKIPKFIVGGLTLMRWKLTLQLAPAREGMKRSPCLLGDDRGELVGVRARTVSMAFFMGREKGIQGQRGTRSQRGQLNHER